MASSAEILEAFNDIKKAMSLSAVDENGKFYCYEYNGTAKVIPIAVFSLLQIRNAFDEKTDKEET